MAYKQKVMLQIPPNENIIISTWQKIFVSFQKCSPEKQEEIIEMLNVIRVAAIDMVKIKNN